MENINLPHEQIANSVCKVDIASTILPALEELAMLPLDEASELHFKTPALHPESHDEFSENPDLPPESPELHSETPELHPEILEIRLVSAHNKSHDRPSSPLWETKVFSSDLQHLQYDRSIDSEYHSYEIQKPTSEIRKQCKSSLHKFTAVNKVTTRYQSQQIGPQQFQPDYPNEHTQLS